MNKEELVELIKIALLNPCKKEHTINKEEQGDYVRFWLTCDKEPIFDENFLKDGLTQNEISAWQVNCLLQHRLDTATESISEAIIASVPHIQAEVSPFANTLHGDIRHVMNKWSVENDANIPDNILATYVIESIKALNIAVRRQNSFFGFKPFADQSKDLEE